MVFSCNQDKKQLVKDAPLISRSFTDATGNVILLPSAPSSVVSIAPSLTEIIFAIGAQDKLVARSEACTYPPAALSIPEVPTLPILDLDSLKRVEADLLISTDDVFDTAAVRLLSQAGMPVFLLKSQRLEDMYTSILALGDLLGENKTARNLADSLLQIEKHIVDSTVNQIHYRTAIIVSSDPLRVVGGTGLLNELIEKAGGMNVFEAAPMALYETTAEEILKAQPEFLIIPAKNDQVYGDLLVQYPALYQTPAEILKQVHIVDPDPFYRASPRMIEGLLTLTHILHSKFSPDIFLEN